MNKMKPLPNIISVARIAGSISLLLCDVTSVAFWIIYGLCGISDIADGWLARKLKCVTKTGALLDSLADICFVACCAWTLLPILGSALPLCFSKELPQWLWLWTGVIVVIKVVNQLSALVMYGHCCFPHTLANKVTGFLLFIAVPTAFISTIPISIVAAIATFAAIQEGHFIRRNAPRQTGKRRARACSLATSSF
jgi:CDP-diacylglycerol--glycerol-3-phosphate 3-phosphatidyltransferase